jgi:arginyl-tRNA synthetase
VRANSIFRKLDAATQSDARELMRAAAHDDGSAKQEITRVLESESGDEIWSLVALAARLDEVIAQSVAAAEPAYLAKYVFTLARTFNLFYHRHRIIGEEDAARRAVLIVACDLTRRQLTKGLTTLGIGVPEQM